MPESLRNEAAERLGTPEHLDRALYVTTAKAWLALCALLAMTVAIVIWTIVGEIATYVQADGIILNRGGMVFDAVSSGGGKLAKVVPAVGGMVEKDAFVAEIVDAEVMERYVSAMALVDERARVLQDRESEAREENALVSQNIVRQRVRLEKIERTSRELVERFSERLRGDRALLARGITNRLAVERGEQALDLARHNLLNVMRQRNELEAGELRRRNDLKARITEAKTEHMEAQRRVNEFATLIETWRIRAPASGRVTEIKAQVGTTLEPGQSVLSIETGGDGLDVLIYVSPSDGKRVKVGMPAKVSPTTVRHEEFGYMIGTVESLSEFPVSLDGMIAVLRNQDLAKTFLTGGPPYPGRVSFTRDASTASGFAWTSPKAVDVNITSGTLAAVEIEVSRRPPIEMVVPWVKEKVGG